MKRPLLYPVVARRVRRMVRKHFEQEPALDEAVLPFAEIVSEEVVRLFTFTELWVWRRRVEGWLP